MVHPLTFSEALPEKLPSPFDELGPHPVARVAAATLQARLPPLDEGKMFGVLVVRAPSGQLGFLAAFSGMLDAAWDVEGFSPPIFDRAARERIEPEGEACVKRLSAREVPDASTPELAELLRRHASELLELRARHDENKRRRRSERERTSDQAAVHALDQQSRADKAERRRREDAFELEAAALKQQVAKLERRRAANDRLRQLVSRRLMQQLHDTYRVPNARGERRLLRALYEPGAPPSGAGDCAAPKLLAAAYAHDLTPIALAEFWWGPPPRSGGRVQGAFYPACKLKCGPLLPFMLSGLGVQPPRLFTPPIDHSELSIVYEDAALVVLEKPAGVLSIPAKELSDSVLRRLRARYPHATGPMIVHRLDLDTSGLLVAALTMESYLHLQRQFASHEVRKRYVALLEGNVTGEHGVIDLPIRVDVHDRPRQIHDPIHGKRAVTEWRVVARSSGRTRVELVPITGRTHQLRVHAAHPLGLGLPIVGDRLYGHGGERLMLHAESLSFAHPSTQKQLHFERPAPF